MTTWLHNPAKCEEPEKLAEYVGVYISGGHGAMDDMPHDAAMTQLMRWVLQDEKPLAVVCHGQSACCRCATPRGGCRTPGSTWSAVTYPSRHLCPTGDGVPEPRRAGS